MLRIDGNKVVAKDVSRNSKGEVLTYNAATGEWEP